MFGRAVYLSNYRSDQFENSCFDYCFTSLHIPEELNVSFGERAAEMLRDFRTRGIKVIADVSPRTLSAMHVRDLSELKEKTGIEIFRLDYGFSKEEIDHIEKTCRIAVNASTALFEAEKQDTKADLAIHNFYPRPETGLDPDFLKECNEKWHAFGIQTAAFIAGDEEKRGPLHKGLPTLEAHRVIPPYVQYLDLKRTYGTDLVLLGDPEISSYEEKLITETEKDGVIRIPAKLKEAHRSLYGKVFHNRPDAPKDFIRCVESRMYATPGETVSPADPTERKRGSITMDNERNLRYSGEIQIVCADYPANDAINVIGYVLPQYLMAADLVGRGDPWMFLPG
ncbi:MAG: MupG family TIM beta-alpha barrel fold protein [Lachnospiraceae bacterium]|nr:MupG family TIM beta-alpha barrel fold protein [Lachnospiraceae bacterium]